MHGPGAAVVGDGLVLSRSEFTHEPTRGRGSPLRVPCQITRQTQRERPQRIRFMEHQSACGRFGVTSFPGTASRQPRRNSRRGLRGGHRAARHARGVCGLHVRRPQSLRSHVEAQIGPTHVEAGRGDVVDGVRVTTFPTVPRRGLRRPVTDHVPPPVCVLAYGPCETSFVCVANYPPSRIRAGSQECMHGPGAAVVGDGLVLSRSEFTHEPTRGRGSPLRVPCQITRQTQRERPQRIRSMEHQSACGRFGVTSFPGTASRQPRRNSRRGLRGGHRAARHARGVCGLHVRRPQSLRSHVEAQIGPTHVEAGRGDVVDGVRVTTFPTVPRRGLRRPVTDHVPPPVCVLAYGPCETSFVCVANYPLELSAISSDCRLPPPSFRPSKSRERGVQLSRSSAGW